MKREIAEAARFARHLGARSVEALPPLLASAPAALVAIAFALTFPLVQATLVEMVSR